MFSVLPETPPSRMAFNAQKSLSLVEKLKLRLPSHSIPRRYIAVKKFNETTSGKIIRRLP